MQRLLKQKIGTAKRITGIEDIKDLLGPEWCTIGICTFYLGHINSNHFLKITGILFFGWGLLFL